MRKIIISSLAAAAFMGWALPAAAQNLAANPSFENSVLGNGGLSQDDIPDWSGSVAGFSNYGVFNNTDNIVARDGANVAFINVAAGTSRGIAQTIGVVAAGERYDARGWFGWRADNPNAANVALELWIGGIVSEGNITGGTRVASVAPVMVQDGWVEGAVSYVVTSADAGQVLSIRLATTSLLGSQTNFDDVSVMKSVPTPVPTLTGWALIVLCFLFAGLASPMIVRLGRQEA